MPHLAVRLLGRPEVRVDGQPVRVTSRKALALLAYLVVEPGPHARGKLAGLLWPDSEPEVARAALRNAVTHLREVLGMVPGRLTADRQVLGMTLQQVDQLDITILAQGNPDAWRGEFLEGFAGDEDEFSAWLTEQREASRACADRAFDQASAACLEESPARAADLAGRWVASDRLNESAWQRLIQARLCEGAMSLAREAFESCQQTLRRELGVDPAPETLALEGKWFEPIQEPHGPEGGHARRGRPPPPLRGPPPGDRTTADGLAHGVQGHGQCGHRAG